MKFVVVCCAFSNCAILLRKEENEKKKSENLSLGGGKIWKSCGCKLSTTIYGDCYAEKVNKGKITVVVWWCVGITTGSCPERLLGEETRKMCPRSCKSDSDCGSKRQCLCDGQCGLSCVAPGNYLYFFVPSVVTVKGNVGSVIKSVCAYLQLCQHTSVHVSLLLENKIKTLNAQNLASKCNFTVEHKLFIMFVCCKLGHHDCKQSTFIQPH